MKRKRKIMLCGVMVLVMALVMAMPMSVSAATAVGTPQQLQEAISSATDGEETVINLSTDIVISSISIPQNKNIVLDLSGNELTVEGGVSVTDSAFINNERSGAVCNEGNLTIRNGNVIISGQNDGILNKGTLTVESSAVVNGTLNEYSGYYNIINLGGEVDISGDIISSNNNGIVTYGGSVNTNGDITAMNEKASAVVIFNREYNNESAGANVAISGGTINTYGYVASTNNLYSGGENGSNLTITGGSLNSHISSIYWPSSGTLTIGVRETTEGPTITSTNGSAVEVCSGTLNVYGGTLNGGTEQTETDRIETSEMWVKAFRENSGSSGIGDAVTIIAKRSGGYVSAPISVNIFGGEFNGARNYGVRYMDCNTTESATQLTQDVSVNIDGGNFSGEIAPVDASFVEETDKKIVSGGEFSAPVPEEYVATGVEAKATYSNNGVTTYLVGKKAIDEKISSITEGTITITDAVDGLQFNAPNDGVSFVNESETDIVVGSGDEEMVVGSNEKYQKPGSPSKPTQPSTTTPADETTAASNDKAVATGDDFNMTSLLAIMGVAAAAAAGTVVYGRRKRSN